MNLKLNSRKNQIVIFEVVFVAAGIALLVLTEASSPRTNFEAESGALTGGANIASDSGASGGKFLRFGGGTDTGEPPGGVQLGRSVSYSSGGHTIKFNFDCDGGDCKYGLFANEVDYWVAPASSGGSVTITSMEPAQIGTGTGVRHGAQIDSSNELAQGWYGAKSYSDSLNFTGGTFTANQISKPKVILKSITRQEAMSGLGENNRCVDNSTRQCLEFVASLTMVAEPPGYVFRPPFFGTGPYKPMVPISEYNDSSWPSVAPAGTLTSWQDAYDTLKFLQPSIFYYPGTEEAFHPRQNVNRDRSYTGYVAKQSESAMLRAVTSTSTAAEAELKRKIKLAIAQRAIDFWAVIENGAGSGANDLCGPWFAAGGFHQGYFGRIMAGSALLGKTQAWSTKLNSLFQTKEGRACFSETGFVQAYEGIGRNAPLFGHIGLFGGGGKTAADPNHRIDGGGNSTSGCVPSYMDQTWEMGRGEIAYLQTIPAVRSYMPDHGKEWADYVKRVNDTGAYCDPNSDSGTFIESKAYRPSGAIEMFNAYRNDNWH